MVLRSLKDAKFLSNLSLDTVQSSREVQLSDLETEVSKESVILNGVPFKPVGRSARGESRGSNCTTSMLKGLCTQLCERTQVNMDGTELYKQLVLRLAHTTGSEGPQVLLDSLLGSSEMYVKALTLDNIQAERDAGMNMLSTVLQKLASQKNNGTSPDQPIDLNVYEAHGEMHITLSQVYQFGLFRRNDVRSGRAWIRIDAVVTERANMTTGKSVRLLNLKLPDLY